MNELKEINLTKILKPYEKDRLWVALYPDCSKVAGVGKTFSEALNNAKSKNIGKPVLIKAAADYLDFAPKD